MTSSHLPNSDTQKTGSQSLSTQVYAIVRFDGFLGEDAPIESRITVKRVMQNFDEATQEAERLNELQTEDGVRYFVQATRMEPEPLASENRESFAETHHA